MLVDSFIERRSVFLYNLNKNSKNVAEGTWLEKNTNNDYGFYKVPYEKPLSLNHYYYIRYQYKYTTTNQSPTWCQYYLQGGGGKGGARINNPTAGDVNTNIASQIMQPVIKNSSAPIIYGTIYHGPNGQTFGAVGSVRNVLIYDITDLMIILNSKLNKTELNKTDLKEICEWCDTNLEYKPNEVPYDISNLIIESNVNNIKIKKGQCLANNIIETDGMQYYSCSDAVRKDPWFDTGNYGVQVYNNTGNNNTGNNSVTFTRVSAKDQNSPFYPKHKYILKITTNGLASPGAGGFVAGHTAAANKVFIERFVAKIPSGYTVSAHYNNQGTLTPTTWLTDTRGTNEWEEYAVLYRCGSSPGADPYSSGGYIAINGPNNTNVTWYLAYVNNCDITGNEYLQYYTVLEIKLT